MTRVYLEQDGRQFTVSCVGHATGSVEVCAAVSCLVYSLAGWLRNAWEDNAEALIERLEDGDAMLQFEGDTVAKAVFDMICVGFLQIQEQYPRYICVDLREK